MEAINWRYSWGSGTLREDIMTESKNHNFLSGEKPTITLRKDVNDDTISFSTYRHTILSPKFRHAAYLAFRITFLVAFPLMIIEEKYRKYILMHTILPLFGIVASQDTLGEQIGMIIMVIQVAIWISLWGLFLWFCNVPSQPIAWWVILFVITFLLALLGDLRCRRLAILMTILMMAAQLANKEVGYIFPLIMTRDWLISLPFALVQALIPPFMMSKRVDKEMARAFIYIGHVVRNSAKACWSPNPVEALEALTKTTLRPLRSVFATLSPQLEIVRYEPMESTLRWQLRVERVNLLRNLMPMLYALSGVSHELHFVQQPLNQQQQEEEENREDQQQRQQEQRGNKILVKEILRERLDEALQPFLDAFDATVKELGKFLNPTDVVNNVPFDDLKETTSQLQSAIDKIHFDVMSFRINPVEPVWYMHIIFAHLMMVLLGEELLKYFEDMRNFNHSRYLSTCRCLLNFFFLEYWNDFCTEFPKRIKLATPRDVRLAKDAFKIAVAYTLGAFFSLYVDTKNPYYFGMTILMGVGLPTAGDTLVAGMQRVAGLLFAIAIAWLVNTYHKNQYDKYAYALFAILVALFSRVFPAFVNCSFYCAILIPLMISSVLSPPVVLSRLVSNSLTVMAYYAIVVFVFPIDTIKVLQNTEVKIMNGISENLSDLMIILKSPINKKNNCEVKEQLSLLKTRSNELWATVRKVQQLIRTAAAEPILRGSPYPVHEQDEFEPVLHNFVASLDIIALGLLCIHRSRVERVKEEFEQVLLSILPPVCDICVFGMYILQDFVDAVQIPKEWSYTQAVKHFSLLMQLNNELKKVFSITHQNIMAAIRGKAREIRINNLKMSMHFVTPYNTVNNISELCEGSFPFLVNSESEDVECQENEREELTAPRNASFLLRPEEFTINHDMNMSIAILVGIDLFCSELEKTLRIMFHLNKFELDRRYKLQRKNE